MAAHYARWLLATWLCLGAGTAALAAPVPLVIGQSLPLTGAGFPVANRVLAGAKAHVERVNASGGLQGRPVELMTLDDGGDPQRHAANLRTLVRTHHALAIVNCLGERACLAAAEATRELQVPLIGPMSGALALRTRDLPHVFSLRPDDGREADALARQLHSTGIASVVLMADGSAPARTEALAAALQRAGLQVTRMAIGDQPGAMEAAFKGFGTQGPQALKSQQAPQALVLNLGHEALAALDRLPAVQRATAPATIATLSTAGLTQLIRSFRERMIGYTSVVPNPELAALPIVRELQRDADEFIGPEALSFEGLEAYLHLRLCTAALRRAGNHLDLRGLGEAIEGLGTLDLGGFRFSFSRERHHGSDFVEIGMRARDGRVLR
jgi:branched-chain amino acid transport system substrate-binding protein